MQLKSGQKIQVHYTDETIGDLHDSIAGAEREICDTVIGCDFAATVEAVLIVDENLNQVDSLSCRWSVKLVRS